MDIKMYVPTKLFWLSEKSNTETSLPQNPVEWSRLSLKLADGEAAIYKLKSICISTGH